MNKTEIIQSKIIQPDQIDRLLALWRFKGETIVFTNGCFDIVHRGHVEYLAQAASLGTKLILGLNADESVKRLKGNDRPINNEESRAIIMASFSFIDAVVLFKEDTPFNLISKVLPDILVKGGDYVIEDIVGYDVVTNNGGQVMTIDFVDGFSSSSIIKKGGLV